MSKMHNPPHPGLTLCIEAWLGVDRGGDARLWLAEQSAYDAWQAEQRFKDAPVARLAA